MKKNEFVHFIAPPGFWVFLPFSVRTLYLRLPCKSILCGACYYLLVLNLDCPVQVMARVLVLFHQKLDCRIIVIGFNAIYYGFYCVSSCVVNQYRLNQVHLFTFLVFRIFLSFV